MSGNVNQASVFGICLSLVTKQQAVEAALSWVEARGPCRYVVTPNVDHIVQLEENVELRAAYRDASMVLTDGWPVAAAAKFLGVPVPEVVTGSDFVPALLSASARRPLTVFLLGAAPGVAEEAARLVIKRWKSVQVVGVYSPPLGFEKDSAECQRIIALVNAASPDLLVLGFGAPKQEQWVARFASLLNARVAICAGATIDFLAGAKSRAPLWMRRTKLEWFHRFLQEPKRMGKRYGRDAIVFPRIVLREWIGKRRRNGGAA